MKMKKTIAAFLCILLAIMLSGCVTNDTSPATYDAFAEKSQVMPTTASFKNAKEIKTLYHHEEDIFAWSAYTLIASFDAQHFPAAVKEARSGFIFETDPLVDKVEENTLDPSFLFDGYSFSVLDLETYADEDSEFPEKITFFGVNESEKKIAFVDFADPDLDVAESFSYILTEYCGWNEIN